MVISFSSPPIVEFGCRRDVPAGRRGQTLQVVQKTSSLAALAMHAEHTENLRQRELKLFFFEFHA